MPALGRSWSVADPLSSHECSPARRGRSIRPDARRGRRRHRRIMKRGHDLGPMNPDRRTWLAGLGIGGVRARRAVAAPTHPDDDPEEADFEAIRAHAKAIGLDPFDVSKTENYAAIGDAPETFRKEALDVCEAVARDCLKYFRDKGFPVKAP